MCAPVLTYELLDEIPSFTFQLTFQACCYMQLLLMWIPGTKLSLSLGGKHRYLPRHLTGHERITYKAASNMTASAEVSAGCLEAWGNKGK